MTLILFVFLAMAQPRPASLDQLKTEPNPERRAHAAVDYALMEEKNAEAAYAQSDSAGLATSLKDMQDALQLAYDSLAASGKKASRNPKQFKYGEQRSRQILKRLESLEQKMDLDERKNIESAKNKVDEIHDAWLEGIMSKQR